MSVDDAMAVYNEFKSQYHNADIGMSFLMLNISENRSSSDVLHRFFEGSLDGEITKMHQLIKEALYDPRADELFTEQAFRYFMSIIALNGQGIGTSALEHYQRQLLTRLQDCDDDNNECTEREAIEMVLEQIEMLEPAIDEVSGEFTHCEGSGLYRMHSKINHSCVPNAIVQFPDNSSTLQVVAIRPINAGEEICISYLEMDDCCEHDADDDDDCCINGNMHSDDGKHMVTDRRETLRQFYLFDCNCPACIQAAGEVAGK
jgi:hypothetical protein